MNYNPKSTLSFYNSTPQVQLHCFSNVAVPTFAANCASYKEAQKSTLPERDAITFYALNHLSAIIRRNFTTHEELPMWAQNVMERYQLELRTQGQRMLNYMALITTREARHCHNNKSYVGPHLEKFGQEVVDFKKILAGSGSEGAVVKFLETPPQTTMGNFFNSLVFTFYKGGFGGQFGGKPWGMIADTLASFIDGKTSLEMMLDTAYTLAHNNGPMFNKGMMYQHYTNDIYKVLDVQRAGQIPELVLDKTLNHLSSGVYDIVAQVRDVYPNEFGSEVDWNKVVAATAGMPNAKPYYDEIKAMKVATPPPPPKPKLYKGFPIIGEFKVFPSQTVDIYSRMTDLPN